MHWHCPALQATQVQQGPQGLYTWQVAKLWLLLVVMVAVMVMRQLLVRVQLQQQWQQQQMGVGLVWQLPWLRVRALRGQGVLLPQGCSTKLGVLLLGVHALLLLVVVVCIQGFLPLQQQQQLGVAAPPSTPTTFQGTVQCVMTSHGLVSPCVSVAGVTPSCQG
jgi:fucose permease